MNEMNYFDKVSKDLIQRFCPICENPLNLSEFRYRNEAQYLNAWSNEKLAIPCCNCFKILSELSQKGKISFKYPYVLGRIWTMLNNLFKMGFITEEVRDMKYKECLDRDREYKLRTKMLHFLV